MDLTDRPEPPSPELDLASAARQLGGPVLIAEGQRIGGWGKGAVGDDLEFVELETDERDDPLLVHTRRRAVPLRTLISLIDRHAERCEITEWSDVDLPGAISAVDLVINGEKAPGVVFDADAVLAAVAGAGGVAVTVVASRSWLEGHGGWPALVTAHDQFR
jgi:hypothetical protein